MDIEKLLNQILRKYGQGVADSKKLAQVMKAIESRRATYRDAEKYASELGRILTDALQEYLPGALTDGRLYRAFADVLIKTPAKRAGADLADVTASIQNLLNEEAGIGLKAIVPKLNEDQLTGIITEIVNADSYEAGLKTLVQQVENLLDGYVDDFVHDNADFQHEAGLTLFVERITTGSKPCEWCQKLAKNSPYSYEAVADKSNDVWKRHLDCKCLIIYDPRGSKRRTVYNGVTSPRRRGK
jgi:hypothetical protein